MTETPIYKLTPCGDHSLIIDFGNTISEEINRHVLSIFYAIKQKNIPGIRDVVPAYSSIMVVYDVVEIRKKWPGAYKFIAEQIEYILHEPTSCQPQQQNLVKIPVCYEEAFAPDLQCMAEHNGIDAQQIPQIHYNKPYHVFTLGFLPGFTYMGTVESTIAMPRKSAPRLKVPAGAVGIAGLQTGIYPVESPGGWNIIGQTPLKLFDTASPTATLLQPGDTVQFYPVTKAEFEEIKALQ